MSRMVCLATLAQATATGVAAWWVRDTDYAFSSVAVLLWLRLALAVFWPTCPPRSRTRHAGGEG